MPLTILIVNLIALVMGILRTVYSVIPEWNKLLGGMFFSFWVLSHMYPFAKGLMGKRGRVPTIIYVWSGILSITIALLWITIDPPSDSIQAGNLEVWDDDGYEEYYAFGKIKIYCKYECGAFFFNFCRLKCKGEHSWLLWKWEMYNREVLLKLLLVCRNIFMFIKL